MVFPAFTMAHGHSPQKFNKYLIDSAFELKINLVNGFSKKTCFDIEINNKINPMLRQCLAAKARRKISVWLQSPADVKTTNTVCSISDIPGIKTRMCTQAVTFYPATQLGNA